MTTQNSGKNTEKLDHIAGWSVKQGRSSGEVWQPPYDLEVTLGIYPREAKMRSHIQKPVCECS